MYDALLLWKGKFQSVDMLVILILILQVTYYDGLYHTCLFFSGF
jgi:hypothetical protein